MTLSEAVDSNWSAVPERAPGGPPGFPTQQSQSSVSRMNPYLWRRQPTHTDRPYRQYEFPTRFGGSFERALSTFAKCPQGELTGRGSQVNYPDDSFKSEVSQALALKLNLKTQQHANEKVLHELVRSGGRCRTLKQAVQARVAVYDEVADPFWFVKNCDIGAKAQLSRQRRVVRSQLITAPLVVAQSGFRNICSMLSTGDWTMLERLRLGDNIPVAETLKLLSLAPPLLVLRLLNREKGSGLVTLLENVSAEMDFVQTVADLVSSGDSINPSLNAMADAFRRRQLTGRFVSENNTIKMNALVYADTKSINDNDFAAKDIKEHYSPKGTQNRGKSSKGVCYLFQRGRCR